MTLRPDGHGGDGDDRTRRYLDDRELRFDDETEAYVLDRRADRNPVVDAVLALARIEGADPLEMTPLYEELAPDALPRVVAAAKRESAEAEEVTFSAYGHTVTIGAGEIRIE